MEDISPFSRVIRTFVLDCQHEFIHLSACHTHEYRFCFRNRVRNRSVSDFEGVNEPLLLCLMALYLFFGVVVPTRWSNNNIRERSRRRMKFMFDLS